MTPRVVALRPVILLFALFVALQAVSAAVLFALKFGLTPASIEHFYFGLARPRSAAGLLEVAVPHLLAIPLTLFIVIHLVAWAGLARGAAFGLLTRASFGLALASIGAGLALRFLWPALSVLKLAAFLGLEATLLLWVYLLLRAFWRPPQRPA